jgi:hypothetical protein
MCGPIRRSSYGITDSGEEDNRHVAFERDARADFPEDLFRHSQDLRPLARRAIGSTKRSGPMRRSHQRGSWSGNTDHSIGSGRPRARLAGTLSRN